MGRISKRKAAAGTVGNDMPGNGKKSGKTYRAGIYARLSADMDAAKNESIDVQISIAKDFVREYNQKNGGINGFIEVVECYSDASDIIGLNQKEPNSKGDAEFSPVLILS